MDWPLVSWKKLEDFFQIFVTFSEYLNFNDGNCEK